MKRLLKIGAVLAVVGILAGIYIWFFVYNKPHRNYEKATADYVLTAGECYQHYASGKTDEENYTGKVLELSGIISLVEQSDSMVILAFVFNEGMFGSEGIRCTMLPSHHQKTLALNIKQGVTVKGFCSGYNGTDVILEQCSIVNN